MSYQIGERGNRRLNKRSAGEQVCQRQGMPIFLEKNKAANRGGKNFFKFFLQGAARAKQSRRGSCTTP